MNNGIYRVLLLVPVFLFSLCFHEYAHAWTAVRRGDKTPLLAGRLTLHPMAHADLVGTFLLPILCIFSGWPFFGWAKPVPIDYRNLKGGRRDVALVAFAGPAANLILVALSAIWLHFLTRFEMRTGLLETAQIFAVISIQVNLLLAAFNLLPVPPLDGFMIAQAFLPGRATARLLALAPFANLALLLLLLSGNSGWLFGPIHYFFKYVITLAAG